MSKLRRMSDEVIKSMAPSPKRLLSSHEYSSGQKVAGGANQQPRSIGLLKCPRCGAGLYEMPGDINWCRYFECRSCDAVFHFPPQPERIKRRRRYSLKPKVVPPPITLVPGRLHRSELIGC